MSAKKKSWHRNATGGIQIAVEGKLPWHKDGYEPKVTERPKPERKRKRRTN